MSMEQPMASVGHLFSDDIVRVESVAYQLHTFYNAVEDLLKLVATHFENNISDAAR